MGEGGHGGRRGYTREVVNRKSCWSQSIRRTLDVFHRGLITVPVEEAIEVWTVLEVYGD